ncbi:MAG: FG-GAP-like repeat-containing protein [Phycisphaerales bacterium]|nr:FG-GAP-like repeat-containing protein [Phycisphaerales bacterium]
MRASILMGLGVLLATPWVAHAQYTQTESALVQWSGVAPGDQFGASVAIDGSLLVVGAPQNSGLAVEGGSALVYAWSERQWVLLKDLAEEVPSGLSPFDKFGASVAVHGSVIAVGMPGDDDLGTNAGAVHLFEWDGSADVSYLTTVYGELAFDENQFGSAVALSENYLAVSSPSADVNGTDDGLVTVFEDDAVLGWSFYALLVNPSGLDDESMGSSVAITESASVGTVVAAGASGANFSAGLVYVFADSGFGFDNGSEISPPTGGTGYYFGWSVAIEGDRLVIGEPGNADDGLADAGTVWIFDYITPGIGWNSTGQLDPGDLNASDRMGASVGIEGDSVVVGIPRGTGLGANTGRADLWAINGFGAWQHFAVYLASDLTGADTGSVGYSLSISGDRVCVGAPTASSVTGVAYIFSNDRSWLSVGGGDWITPSNWSGNQIPDIESRILFDLDAIYDVEVDSANAEGGSMRVSNGFVTIKDSTSAGSLSLNGGNGLTVGGDPTSVTSLSIEALSLYLDGGITVGDSGGGDGRLELQSLNFAAGIQGPVTLGALGNGVMVVDNCPSTTITGVLTVGADASGELTLQNSSILRLFSDDGSIPGYINNGTLSIDEGCQLEAEVGLDIQANGVLSGAGDITAADIYSFGRLRVDASALTGLRFSGNYYGFNESLAGTLDYALTICDDVQLGGAFAVQVIGSAYIYGGCVVNPLAADTLQVGDVLNIISAGSLSGDYGVWFVPAIGDDAYLSPVTPALRGVGDEVSLEVRDLGSTFGFNSDGIGDGESGSPIAVVVEDFDGDDVDDVAVVVSGATNSLDLWLNNGEGTLCLETQISLAAGPGDLTAADFDQDGDLDLATVIPDNDEALVFLNDGTGVLSLGATLTTGDRPEGITAFSVNNDVYPDLAVTNYNDNEVGTFTNTTSPAPLMALSFDAQITFSTVDKPKPIKPGAVGVSGGKEDDLVVGGDDGGAAHENDTLLSGLDAAVFFGSGLVIDDLAVLDLDGDGDDDVAVTLSGTDSLAIIANDLDDSGVFLDAVPNASGSSGGDIYADDIDDDGDDDLVLVETDSGTGIPEVVALRNDSPSISTLGSGRGCATGFVQDCIGNCVPDYWLGDGVCDDGSFEYNGLPVYLNCLELQCDGGDCVDCCLDPGLLPDCNGNCAPASWLGDGFCDDGTYDYQGVSIFYNCDEYYCDFDDCVCEDVTGACCTDIGCVQVTEDECLIAGGLFQGEGSFCDTNPCEDKGSDLVAVLSRYNMSGTRGTLTAHLVSAGDIDADGLTDIVQIQQDGSSYTIVVNTDGDASAWSPGSCCLGDIDGSGGVDVDDLLAVIAAFGTCGDPSNCPADLDGNGAVDVDDLLTVIAAFGSC